MTQREYEFGGETFTMDVEVEGKCPCGTGEFTVGRIGSEMAVVHTEPACETYMELEGDRFLQWIRERLSGN